MNERASRIAVVGIGCRFPGARDHREFYANLRDRVDSVREIPADRFDTTELYDPDRGAPNKSISKWCGLVDQPYAFDHEFFGISPREARLLDPLQRLLMEVTYHCVEDAGTTVAALGEGRTSVYVGNMERDHMAELTTPGHDVESHSVLGVYDCLLANRLSQAFGLSGTSVAVDAACASALVAVHLGMQALATGEADHVLAGGVNLNLHPWKYIGFSKSRMLSPTGRCQTFDRDADGFVPGDGVGMVLLKRLDDALRDGDHVYGVLRGSAVNHGRRRTTITAPTVASQREVVSAAIERAGVSPRDITFVETHGTGTSLGDPIEVEALRQVFGPASDDHGWCTLGAVKSNIGHLEGAAGIAGLIKVLMMMAERRVVPNLHLRNLNPLIDLDGAPFTLALDNADWRPAEPGAPLRAGVSSFGFGGVNAHLVVEELVAPERVQPPARPRPFLLSAATAVSLRALTARWRAERWLDTPVADAATTLAVGRTHLPHRIGGVVTGRADIEAVLDSEPVEAVAERWAVRVGLLDDGQGPGKRCRATAHVLSTLLRLGLRPDLLCPTSQGIWPCLAAAGVLDLDTAVALAGGERPEVALRPPAVAVAVAGTVVRPFTVDARYLDELRAAPVPPEDQLRPLLDLAGRLGGQRTFQNNLRDWQRALTDRAETPLVRALSAQNALDRLNRKWDLPLNRFVRDERTVELLDLLLDGVLEPADVLDLLDGTIPAGHQDRVDLTDPARYPILRRTGGQAQLDTLIRFAESDVDAEVPAGLAVVSVGAGGPAEVTVASGDSLTEPLVELWRRGVDVRWEDHPAAAEGTRVSLPTTEFDRQEHRITPLTAAPVAEPDGAGIVELRQDWVSTDRVPAPTGGPVLVVLPAGATRVRRAAEVALPGTVRFTEPDSDFGSPAGPVVLVAGDPVETAVAALRLAKAAYGRGVRILAVGGHVNGVVAPGLAALTGLARTLARETDTVELRAVAVPGELTEPSTWDVVAGELGRVDGTDLVRHHDGVRTARQYVPAEPVRQERGVRPGGTYLLTGGTGGLGVLVTEHLLATPGVRVALVGRSPDPGGHRSDRVAYFQADVSDPAQAVDVVARVRERFGPLTGILHSAGVLRDGYLVHKSAEDMRAVLAPKVLGAVNLDEATRDEPLELFVLFSSMVACVGNPGQADYGTANAFLDQFAEQREALRAAGRRSGRSVSIGWPVWRDGGMTVTGRGVLGPDSGVLPMPTPTALAAFDRFLASGTGAHPFIYGDPGRVVSLLELAAPTRRAPAEPPREQALEWARDYVATLVAELRGVPAADIDLELGLDRFGLDSIVISEFNAKLEAQLGAVSETLLFESRTLAAAAARIAERRPAELAARYGGQVSTPAVTEPRPSTQDIAVEPVGDGDIAVIGLAGRYPMAPDLDTFWRNLAQGRDSVTEVPAARWATGDDQETYCRWGAFLDDVDRFDPLFFAISPREAETMDPQERLFLQTAWHAFEDAGYPPRRLGDPEDPGARSVGVFVGVTTQTYLLWGPDQQRAGNPVVPPSPQWSIANRVSYWLDLRGPSMPVDTACAASLTAIHLAARSMAAGECSMALVGGVNLYLHKAKYDWLCRLGMLSRTGRCHTFGAAADGFVPGEGVGAALLKPLAAALADGDRILGVVKGSAVNHGGRTNGFTVPSPTAQAQLVGDALADAGVDPATIGYVEAHGTGTALGDPIEITGLTSAYPGVPAGSCAIGSVKTNIGHLESASGMAGLTKVLLQFQHGQLAPSLHATEPNPRIDLAASPFAVQHELAGWPRGDLPRRAGISSFGAGGANAHVIVEEAPTVTAPRGPAGGEHLVVVSANDVERLREHCANLAGAIRARAGELRVSEIAYQLQVRREPLAVRLALLAEDPETLADRLTAYAEGRPVDGRHWTATRERPPREELAEAVTRRDWATVAAAWVAGADVPWESMHERAPRHVPLPGYPFARERYWLPDLPRETTPGTTVELTDRDPFLDEHRVGGVPILPAAGCLELVRAAAGLGETVRLRNNVWTAPIMVPEPRTVRVSLTGTAYEVHAAAGEPVSHVTGRIETLSAPEDETLDVAAIRDRCRETLTGDLLYPDVRRRGLDLGPTYQGITRLHWNDDEALSEIRLPGQDSGGHVLHPGVLDSAFQASLWLLGRRFDRLHLPFSIGEVDVLGPTPARGFAHVVLRKVTGTGSKVEVRLADEHGRVVFRAKDFWVRPWQASAPGSYFRPQWTIEEPAERHDPGTVVVLAGSEHDADELRRHLTGPVLASSDVSGADTVVYVCPERPPANVADQVDDALLPLFDLTRALVADRDKRPVRLVCAIPAGVPAYQALGGFLRTVSLECPRISHVLVENATPARLAAEITGATAGSEVRHGDSGRTVRSWQRFEPAPTEQVVRRDGVYLVTGGAGGLGALVAEWLAETAGARLVLAGRSPAGPEVDALLDRIRTRGGQARYVTADVSTADGARAAVLAADTEFGALHGIFHCAGVLRDGYLGQQSVDALREVTAGKVLGAVHLDAATAGRSLDLFCLFSSVASAIGSAGQAGYAYANGFLDAFAATRPGPTVSVNWPLWADGGMGVDDEVAEWLRVNLGLRPLETGQGLAALSAVLGGPDRQVVFVPGAGEQVEARLTTATPRAESPAAQGDFAPAVRELVTSEIAAIVKLDPARIDPERAIGDYGFDSLSFSKLANQLVKRLSVDITPALFFEYTTVAEVAEHLAGTYPDELAAHLTPAERRAASAPAPVPAAPAPARRSGPEPIAIIGMHGMLPGSRDLDEYWRNLDAGRDLVTEIPADRWDWREYYHPTAGPGRTNSKWGGFLPEVDTFDARFFGITRREAELMDPQQRLFLQTAYKAIEEAGYRPADLAKGTTGLFVGVASHDYYDLLREAGVPVEAYTTTGLFHAILANRVSYLLNLSGPSFPIDTACSSSLVALRSAVESINAGSCDTAIVGGVNLLLSPMIYISFARAGMLSPTGRCRTFDAGADGYVRAEGVGALLLKPLSAAERDGDHVHAVIRGSAVNHGGKVNTLTTPNPNAQAELIVRAFEEGGVDPATVGYLELHGTGTALGDPIEINGVKRAFDELRDRAGLPRLTEPTTRIGSVKSNIGHLESAAGLAGIFKVLLAMKHGRVPGNLHLQEVNPQIRLAGSPLSITDRTTAWPRPRSGDGAELPRRAGVSSFGFGGVNGHVLLEEHPAEPVSPSAGEQVFVVSARDPERLREYAGALAGAVRPVASGQPAGIAELTGVVADLLDVPAAEVPADEPLADLGVEPWRLTGRLADAGWPALPDRIAAMTITELAANGPATDQPSPAGELADIAFTLQVGREPMAHRLAVVTGSAAVLADELAGFAATGTPGARTSVGVAEDTRGPVATGAPRELARRWVEGATVDWPAVHEHRRPRRVSLPTYPFARDRYWLPERAETRPLVTGEGERDGDGVVFRVRLSAADRIVHEHRVHGENVLAGVVQVELAAAALAGHRPGRHRLTRVSWTRPLVVAEPGREVLVRLTERDGEVVHEVQTVQDGEVVTHSTGRWHRVEPTAPAPLDLDAIRDRCRTGHHRDAIYRAFEGMDITYGPLFRGLRDALTGDGELLASFTAEPLPHPVTFHPTVLDAALQAITVLDGAEAGRTRLPFSAEAIELLAPSPRTGYVHVLARDTGGHDVTVTGEDGRPHVLLREVTVRAEPDPLDGLFYRPHWVPQDAPAAEPVRGASLIVHSRQSYGLDTALAARLGGPVRRVLLGEHNRRVDDGTWEVDVAAPDLRACLRDADVRHVWFLGGLATGGDVRRGAPMLFRLVRALVDVDAIQHVESIRSVTLGAQDAGGRRVTDPAAASVAGLSRSLAKEYPRIGVSCVDLGDEPVDAERVAAMLLAEPAHQDGGEVAISGGRRLVRGLRPVHLPPPARSPFRDGGGYLIVGGAGGIGLALAEHLAATVSARLVLVGRSPLGQDVERALARLGGQATYQQADVTDPDELRAVVAKAKAQGPLHGVVHAAMVLRDGIVERLTEDAFDSVLAPKADGTRVLGDVLAGESLDFLLVLSSVQSFTGAAGQGNYAAASTAQDAFAHRIAASVGYPVHVVNWGPWAEVGRVADYHDNLTRRGYRPIDPATGIAAIERVLAADERQLVALRADEAVLDAIGVTGTAERAETAPAPVYAGDPAERDALDEFITAALWHTVGRLGLFTRPGETHRRADLPARLGALPEYRGLVDALADVLVRGGFLQERGGEVSAGEVPPPFAPDPRPLRGRHPNLGARLDLATRCLDALPEVLTGARPATEVLFPRGTADTVATIYRGETLVDYCNAVVAGQVAAVAGDGPLRVLELGAGTGSTSEVVLAALASAGVAAEYDFTDLAGGLVRQAARRLDRHGVDVRFRELDIERPASAQGFPPGHYDVVLAGNVLHATRDLDAVLGEIRGLLAPGGRLVLTEVTAVQPFHTVTFGLLDGWWRFADGHRRLPGAPLLDPHLWRQRLEAADFTGVAVLGAAATPGRLPQRVLVATAPAGPPASPREVVPAEDAVRALVTERVAECLGVPVYDVDPGTPLPALGVDSIVAVELTNQLSDALGVVLKTAVVFDHPTVDALTAYLARRHTPAAPVPPAPPPAEEHGFHAVRFERPGDPRDLRIVPVEPVAPGAGEVEVLVRAFPINFSDFLLAKGLYPMMPDFPFTPGVEVSGVVRRVGPGVRRFAPGDEVIALTRPEMGGQASVVLTDEDMLVAKPPNVTHEEACGFPVAFLAMYLAFERAAVRPGERVLVPAATGTNGLVAVQLARLAGAEVIATAGAPHKIDYLASIGVPDAIDHRRADVVREVLRRTGGTGVDVVINTLGGEAPQQGIDVLAPEGRYVEIAVFALSSSTGLDLSRLVDNQSFHSFNTKKYFLRHTDRRAEYLRIAAEHLGSGRITPTVAHVLPFDRITEAYALKEDRDLIGRVVVTMPDAG